MAANTPTTAASTAPRSFIEKPNAQTAQQLIETGLAYWASGISLMRADTVIEEYRRFDPVTFGAVSASLANAEARSTARWCSRNASFGTAESLPTERAVFEKSKSVALAPADVEWDDVGAWAAFHTIGKKTDDGNVVTGDVMMVNSRDSYVRGGNRLVAVVGVQNLVVVDTQDALLVTTQDQSQDVKKSRRAAQGAEPPRGRSTTPSAPPIGASRASSRRAPAISCGT